MSHTHAKLILNYDHALIEDLGSPGGTQVNGRTIPKDERMRLWPNQKILVGTATIELRRLKVEVSGQSLAPAGSGGSAAKLVSVSARPGARPAISARLGVRWRIAAGGFGICPERRASGQRMKFTSSWRNKAGRSGPFSLTSP